MQQSVQEWADGPVQRPKRAGVGGLGAGLMDCVWAGGWRFGRWLSLEAAGHGPAIEKEWARVADPRVWKRAGPGGLGAGGGLGGVPPQPSGLLRRKGQTWELSPRTGA